MVRYGVHPVPLPSGHEAIVDKADAELVAGFRWRVLESHTGLLYAHAWHGSWHLYMHRLVLGAPEGMMVDHKNGNGLDNRTANLRLTDNSGNQANATGGLRSRSGSSQYRGVTWDRDRSKWMAAIKVRGVRRHLGRFMDEASAARAWNRAALEAWGDMARLNIIEETDADTQPQQ
jgi:hypothetical protein